MWLVCGLLGATAVMSSRLVQIAIVAGAVATPARALCETGPDVARNDGRVGVGYKAGNGHGLAGAELLVGLTPSLSANLYGAAIWQDGGRGFALAPTLQLGGRGRPSAPYLSLGVEVVQVWFDDIAARGFGVLVNAGYELALGRELALQLGVGLRGLQEVSGTSGMTTVSQRSFVAPNAELGLRYRFR